MAPFESHPNTDSNPYRSPAEVRSQPAYRKRSAPRDHRWHSKFAPTNGWATIVVASFCLLASTTLANIATHLQWAIAIESVTVGMRISRGVLEGYAFNMLMSVLIGAGVYVLVSIFFIIWFAKAYSNLPALGTVKLDYGRGWAIGGWFVPILSLVRPYQIGRDLWIYSSPRTFKSNVRAIRNLSKSQVNLWWSTFLITSLIGQFAFMREPSKSGVGGLAQSVFDAYMVVGFHTFRLVAIGYAINFVIKVTRWQTTRYKLVLSEADCEQSQENPRKDDQFEDSD